MLGYLEVSENQSRQYLDARALVRAYDDAQRAVLRRDPLKRPKGALQARLVQELWDTYLRHREGV